MFQVDGDRVEKFASVFHLLYDLSLVCFQDVQGNSSGEFCFNVLQKLVSYMGKTYVAKIMLKIEKKRYALSVVQES